MEIIELESLEVEEKSGIFLMVMMMTVMIIIMMVNNNIH